MILLYFFSHVLCDCCPQLNLMRSIQAAIKEDRFPDYIRDFFALRYPTGEYPAWIVDALAKVNVTLDNAVGGRGGGDENGGKKLELDGDESCHGDSEHVVAHGRSSSVNLEVR